MAAKKIVDLDDLASCGQRSADYTASVALSAARSINNDRPNPASFTLPVTGWAQDAEETSGYIYYYDFAVNGLTTAYMAEGIIDRASGDAARGCGLCEEAETLEGKIRFRARSAPGSAITGVYWLRTIKENLGV